MAVTLIDRLPPAQRGEAAYLIGAAFLRRGDYDKGREWMFRVIAQYYDANATLWGGSEKVRNLAAVELAYFAGDRGRAGDIEVLAASLDRDLRTDRITVRDFSGKDFGRNKVADLLLFHRARAYKNAKMGAKALEVLKQLSYVSGNVFVEGRVEGLPEAVAKLQAEVKALASRLFRLPRLIRDRVPAWGSV